MDTIDGGRMKAEVIPYDEEIGATYDPNSLREKTFADADVFDLEAGVLHKYEDFQQHGGEDESNNLISNEGMIRPPATKPTNRKGLTEKDKTMNKELITIRQATVRLQKELKDTNSKLKKEEQKTNKQEEAIQVNKQTLLLQKMRLTTIQPNEKKLKVEMKDNKNNIEIVRTKQLMIQRIQMKHLAELQKHDKLITENTRMTLKNAKEIQENQHAIKQEEKERKQGDVDTLHKAVREATKAAIAAAKVRKAATTSIWQKIVNFFEKGFKGIEHWFSDIWDFLTKYIWYIVFGIVALIIALIIIKVTKCRCLKCWESKTEKITKKMDKTLEEFRVTNPTEATYITERTDKQLITEIAIVMKRWESSRLRSVIDVADDLIELAREKRKKDILSESEDSKEKVPFLQEYSRL